MQDQDELILNNCLDLIHNSCNYFDKDEISKNDLFSVKNGAKSIQYKGNNFH